MDDPRRPQKPRTSPFGHPVPAHVAAQTPGPISWDEAPVTGVHTGEALAEARARRPTDVRFAHIEGRLDETAKTANATALAVAGMAGELKVLPELVDMIKQSAARAEQREHVTFTSQVQVDTAGRLATIADTADARRTRRALVAKVVAGAVALVTSGAFLHWLLGRV